MPITGVPPLVVAIYKTDAGQNMVHTVSTIVNFDTKVQDTHDAVTTGAAWKFTAPVVGFYQVGVFTMFVQTDVWDDGELQVLQLYVNNVRVAVLERMHMFASAVERYVQSRGNVLVHLNVGDFADIRMYQGSGDDLALHADSVYNWVTFAKYVGG